MNENIEVKEVTREISCNGCDKRNARIMVLFAYATQPIYLCDKCRKESIALLSNE